MRGSFRIEVSRQRDRGNIEGGADLPPRGGEQEDGAKVGAFVQQRVLHLYGVGESFVERLMCSAKRRNKIKTKRLAPEYEGGRAGQGINPKINQTVGARVRRSSSRRHSLRYRFHTGIICIRYFIGSTRLDPDNFVVSSGFRWNHLCVTCDFLITHVV